MFALDGLWLAIGAARSSHATCGPMRCRVDVDRTVDACIITRSRAPPRLCTNEKIIFTVTTLFSLYSTLLPLLSTLLYSTLVYEYTYQVYQVGADDFGMHHGESMMMHW